MVQCFLGKMTKVSFFFCPPLAIREYFSVGRRAAKQRRYLNKSSTHSEKFFDYEVEECRNTAVFQITKQYSLTNFPL